MSPEKPDLAAIRLRCDGVAGSAEFIAHARGDIPMLLIYVDRLHALLRTAVVDLIEPMGISHLTKDTEWRVAAEAWLKEVAPLAFARDEAVFGRRL